MLHTLADRKIVMKAMMRRFPHGHALTFLYLPNEGQENDPH